MKTLTQHINEWKLTNDSNVKIKTVKVESYKELSSIIYDRYQEDNKIIDLSDIDVSNIISFSEQGVWEPYYYGLFACLDNVEIINITGWNISNAKSLACMFYKCINLKTILGIEKLNVSNVTTFKGMFYHCESLKCNLNNWKVRKDANIYDMFIDCYSLTLPKWYNIKK